MSPVHFRIRAPRGASPAYIYHDTRYPACRSALNRRHGRHEDSIGQTPSLGRAILRMPCRVRASGRWSLAHSMVEGHGVSIVCQLCVQDRRRTPILAFAVLAGPASIIAHDARFLEIFRPFRSSWTEIRPRCWQLGPANRQWAVGSKIGTHSVRAANRRTPPNQRATCAKPPAGQHPGPPSIPRPILPPGSARRAVVRRAAGLS